MLGFISFIVVLALLSATLSLICVTLDDASNAVVAALRGHARAPVSITTVRPRLARQVVVTRPAFAPLRVAA